MTARLLVLLRLFIALALVVGLGPATARDNRYDSRSERQATEALEPVALATLPVEARETLALIKRGGPFPYPRKDGSTFGNFEKRLPAKPRGHYREYTVPTPGSRDRGARRIVAGSPPETSGEYYYTDDHYRSFRRIKE
ncbi:MAG TPA: ribonuclease domain-containing protein [Azospira sp.]|nr:ribonuclease domain-containing protein [Accumulibacter sp.]HNJ77090.1 ribonuclease domain-containing protein [Azospira sp.]HNN09293.1 ribonuclease domain-containing protein [Azospira sp.]HNN46074.1 ribonuclease domain-containing protein [Azospira sp.]